MPARANAFDDLILEDAEELGLQRRRHSPISSMGRSRACLPRRRLRTTINSA